MNLARFLILVLFLCPAAQAWDAHHYITSISLSGLRDKDRAAWAALSTTVEVTPIEQFLEKAFGKECTFEKAKDTVFDGIGKYYQVFYVQGMRYYFDLDWSRGISRLHLLPQPAPGQPNPQALGKHVRALDVISVYSDEPDWLLDDDVPRLKGKGLVDDAEGTGTRMLRHFWFEGEKHLGFEFGKDQETDERMQLYYELALVAFSVGEPYWGYRFLGNSLHYLQDMTQPFHVRALINDTYVDNFALLHAALCKFHPADPLCKPEDTLAAAVINNGWVLGAYHSLYEDFARGMMVSDRFNPVSLILDEGGYAERIGDEAGAIAVLNWDLNDSGLLDLRGTIRAAQRAIYPMAEPVGQAVYDLFGIKYRYDMDQTKSAIMISGRESEGYLLATYSQLEDWDHMTNAQWRARQELLRLTGPLFARAGIWGRHYIEYAIRSFNTATQRKGVSQLHDKFANRCVPPPSREPRH